ncbi:MAG: anti-sigma factor [Pseudomonadaceae bacterium]|nr:anti-sigma factor [Pseudomonadaceae bacterium]
MKYENPALLDQLASEYVLGTLSALARRRFERLMQHEPAAVAAVEKWQVELSDLTYLLPEEKPPARVWRDIEARAFRKRPASSRLHVAWTAFATLGFFGLLLTQFLTIPGVARPPSDLPLKVSFVNEADSEPLWVVSLDLDTGKLRTKAISASAEAADKAYELWMLPNEGNPRSLGLLPVNGATNESTFSPALLELIQNSQGLAVSIEPSGGSPTGVPTGPVVYQSSLINL